MPKPSHVLALVLPCLCLAGEAVAAPAVKGAHDKRFRLHIDTNIFDFTHFDFDGGDADMDDEINAVGFGVGRPTVIDGNRGGFDLVTRSMIGIGFGYIFLKNRAIIGGRASFNVDGIDVGDEDAKATLVTGQLVPYFHWMFLPGRWVRPYVEGRYGFGGGTVSFLEDFDGDGVFERATTHLIFPTFGIGGGVHLFPVEYFSVDLGLDLDYAAPHTRQTFEDPDANDTDWDKVGDGIALAIRAGLSVYF